MRLFILFDLPVDTAQNQRDYRFFRKSLINEGFLMIQESVYVRITPTRQAAQMLEDRLRKSSPPEGLVQSLIVTEKQYASMTFLTGECVDDVWNRDDRVIII